MFFLAAMTSGKSKTTLAAASVPWPQMGGSKSPVGIMKRMDRRSTPDTPVSGVREVGETTTKIGWLKFRAIFPSSSKGRDVSRKITTAGFPPKGSSEKATAIVKGTESPVINAKWYNQTRLSEYY